MKREPIGVHWFLVIAVVFGCWYGLIQNGTLPDFSFPWEESLEPAFYDLMEE